MKISVITASFNSERFLESAINSVAQQTYKNIEYIIVDGGSTDKTLEIINRKSNFIDKFLSEPDHGIYFALNKGIKLATGNIICFMHSDDVFASNDTLQSVADIFTKSNADIVYGDLIYISREKEAKVIRYWKSGIFNKNSLFFGWMPPHTATFIKSQVYSEKGSFNTSLRIAADYEFLLRTLSDKRIHTSYLPKVIVKMRAGGISNSSILNIIQKSREDYRALKINKLPFPFVTLFLKNMRKITQLINFK